MQQPGFNSFKAALLKVRVRQIAFGGARHALVRQIPLNLRKLYVHAYQSFVWNHMASARLVRCDRRRLYTQ